MESVVALATRGKVVVTTPNNDNGKTKRVAMATAVARLIVEEIIEMVIIQINTAKPLLVILPVQHTLKNSATTR